jgi:hypothetical protein
MRFADESLSLAPDERRAEIASILAAGILRLRARAALPDDEKLAVRCLAFTALSARAYAHLLVSGKVSVPRDSGREQGFHVARQSSRCVATVAYSRPVSRPIILSTLFLSAVRPRSRFIY